MNPAAPVTSKRMAPSLVRALVLRFLLVLRRLRLSALVVAVLVLRAETVRDLVEGGADFVALRLEHLRALEVRLCLGATAELEQRVAEVVVRVALSRIGRAYALQRRDGLTEKRERLVVAPLLHQRPRLVVELLGRRRCRDRGRRGRALSSRRGRRGSRWRGRKVVLR